MLVSWLLALIFERMFSTIFKCQYAFEIWNTLELEFVSEPKSQLLHVGVLLQNYKKDSLLVGEYVLKIKSYIKVLSSRGQHLGDKQIINYILKGLGLEYAAIVANSMSRIEYKNDFLTLPEPQYLF